MTCPAAPFRDAKPLARRSWTGMLAACDRLVLVAGWMSVNLLAALGLLAMLFAALGQFTFAGFFAEMGHLAEHYRGAAASQQGAFETGTVWMLAGFTAAIAMLRLRGLRARLQEGAGKSLPGHEELPR